MEMEGAVKDPAQQQYGVDTGYSEDYGAVKQPDLHATSADDPGYGTMNTNNDGQPVNPFTQQQYSEPQKNSNPFKQ